MTVVDTSRNLSGDPVVWQMPASANEYDESMSVPAPPITAMPYFPPRPKYSGGEQVRYNAAAAASERAIRDDVKRAAMSESSRVEFSHSFLKGTNRNSMNQPCIGFDLTRHFTQHGLCNATTVS